MKSKETISLIHNFQYQLTLTIPGKIRVREQFNEDTVRGNNARRENEARRMVTYDNAA